MIKDYINSKSAKNYNKNEIATNLSQELRDAIGLPIDNLTSQYQPSVTGYSYSQKMRKNDYKPFEELDDNKKIDVIMGNYVSGVYNFVMDNYLTNNKLNNMTLNQFQELYNKHFNESKVKITQEMFDNFKTFINNTGITEPSMIKSLKRHMDSSISAMHHVSKQYLKIKIMQEIADTIEKEQILQIKKQIEENDKDIKQMKKEWMSLLNPLGLFTEVALSPVLAVMSISKIIKGEKEAPNAKSMNKNQTIEALLKISKETNDRYYENLAATENTKMKDVIKKIEKVAKENNIELLTTQDIKNMVEKAYTSETEILNDIIKGGIEKGSIIDIENLIIYSPASQLFDKIEENSKTQQTSIDETHFEIEEYSY